MFSSAQTPKEPHSRPRTKVLTQSWPKQTSTLRSSSATAKTMYQSIGSRRQKLKNNFQFRLPNHLAVDAPRSYRRYRAFNILRVRQLSEWYLSCQDHLQSQRYRPRANSPKTPRHRRPDVPLMPRWPPVPEGLRNHHNNSEIDPNELVIGYPSRIHQILGGACVASSYLFDPMFVMIMYILT